MELIWGTWFVFGAITGYIVFKAAYRDAEEKHGTKHDNCCAGNVCDGCRYRRGNNGCDKQLEGVKK